MSTNINILLTHLPTALLQTLEEQYTRLDGVILLNKIQQNLRPDLVIAGTEYENPYTACPVIPLAPDTKHRLSDILRHTYQALTHPVSYVGSLTLHGNILFRPQEKLISKNGKDVALTDREVDTLLYLAKHHGHSVMRETLLKKVWHYQEGIDTHTIETHVYRLRQKIEKELGVQEIIVTTHNGYRLNM